MYYAIALVGVLISALIFSAGVAYERYFGLAVRAQAEAIDTCARKAWVYPEGCEMRAVVVKGRDLLPIPEGMGGK